MLRMDTLNRFLRTPLPMPVSRPAPLLSHVSPRATRALAPAQRHTVRCESFAERARELVTFLAEVRGEASAVLELEAQLAEWITHWQSASRSPGRESHFVAEELGIIVRALSGPMPVARLEGDTEAFRWVIARCMSLNQ